jgi:indolepyruvate ferredoxin oxidoreductase
VATLTSRVAAAAGNQPVLLDASAMTTALLGDASSANVAVLGAAYQSGCIPVSASAIEEAIGLNGVAVEKNVAAFRWGRATVSDPSAVASAMDLVAPAKIAGPPALPANLEATVQKLAALDTLATQNRPQEGTLGALVHNRVAELIAFQDRRCAAEYLALLEKVSLRETAVLPGSTSLTYAVATYLFQLTAYKDEYEVARLLTSPEATAAAEAVGGTGAQITWKLHPPMLRSLGMKSKIALGPKTRPLMVALAKAKRLRGTKMDPFGRAHVRVLERALLAEYRVAIDQLLRSLSIDNLNEAVRIASLPDMVRGYESRKVANAATYQSQLHDALQRWP